MRIEQFWNFTEPLGYGIRREVNFPMTDHQFLDFYHPSEKVYECSNSLYGYEKHKGERRTKDKPHTVKHEGKKLPQALKRSRKRRKSKATKQALGKLIDSLFQTHPTK